LPSKSRIWRLAALAAAGGVQGKIVLTL